MRTEWDDFSFVAAKTEFANLTDSSSLLESAFFIKGLRDNLKWTSNIMENKKEEKKKRTNVCCNRNEKLNNESAFYIHSTDRSCKVVCTCTYANERIKIFLFYSILNFENGENWVTNLLLFLLFDFAEKEVVDGVGAQLAVGDVEDEHVVGFPNKFSPDDDDGTGVTCHRRWVEHRSSDDWRLVKQ